MVQETYPSGRVVKNEFEADGDLKDVVGKKAGSNIFKTYVSNFSYTAAGGISQMELGNGKWETAKFNSRLQVYELGLGNSATDASLWKTNYDYGELDGSGNVDATKNTGNIAKQTLTVPGASFVQAYNYDSLYRLTQAKETSGATQNWIQNWNYDRYGNRTGFSNNVSGFAPITTTPSVDPNTNRFDLGQGFTYDKNGNVVQDHDPVTGHNRQFVFNGDNKQTQVKDIDNSNQVVGTYYYDGEGKRVKKVTDQETTVFVYSSGKLIAEYSTQLAAEPHTSYTTTDHLGSPRIITDELGQVKSRRDFMPFGEDIFATIGARSDAALHYSTSTDDLRQKFTGYQKDNETSLDFAEARMYENRFGRFTAVDPLLASGKSANPQSFNRYVYVGNSPLGITDPNGLIWYRTFSGNKDRPWQYQWFDSNPDKKKWEEVDFGNYSNVYTPIYDAANDSGSLGTVYLNRYSNSFLSQSEYDKVSRQHSMFEPGSDCFANPQCAGVRDAIHDGQGIGAFGEFSDGARIGFLNKAKSSVDPTLVDLSLLIPGTSLHNLFGVPTVFNYETPKPGIQTLGNAAGSVGFDLLSAFVMERVGSRAAGSTAPTQTGFYLHEFESGKFYAGKGPIGRMKQSGQQLSRAYNDPLVSSRFFPASSNREAFLGEHNIMMLRGGPQSFNPFSPTYNKIFSPGRKLGDPNQ